MVKVMSLHPKNMKKQDLQKATGISATCEEARLFYSKNSRGVRRSDDMRAKLSRSLTGHEVSNETRKKLSIAATINSTGRVLSLETKEKISKANSGKKWTTEQCIAQSERCKGRIPWNKGLKNSYTYTMSEDGKERHHNAVSKPKKKLMKAVKCIELNKIFECALTACRELNIPECKNIAIRRACNSNNKTKIIGGYCWEWANE